MGLGSSERINLLALRAELSDPADKAIIDKKLRASPHVANVTLTMALVDPFLEISGGSDGPGVVNGYVQSGPLADQMVRYLTEELDPAWWTPEWGASWYVKAINAIDPKVDLEHEVAPGRTSKQSSYPDDEDTKLTFANIEEALKWAVSYIDANQDDIKELLDDETGDPPHRDPVLPITG